MSFNMTGNSYTQGLKKDPSPFSGLRELMR